MQSLSKRLTLSTKALLSGVALIATAAAADAADLRKDLVVTDSVVRLADLFTDTGAAGEAIVMEAPAPGKRKAISNYQLVRLAEEHKLDWDRPKYLKRVYLEREGVAFSLNDLTQRILDMAREQDLDGDVEISVYGRKKGLFLPFGYTVDDISFKEFELSEQRDRFSGVIDIPTGNSEIFEQRITGVIQEVRMVPMLNRVVTPGEVITDADIEWKKHPLRRIGRNAILSNQQLVGMTVKRPMTAGRLLKESDVSAPVMIAKGSIVMMTYKKGLLTLTMHGRALENGGHGDTIRLMNQKSKKTIYGQVVSADQVQVAASPMMKLASR